MKFALCLSGHLRTFDSILPYLKQSVIDPLNCDIFIHTWDVIGSPTNKNPGDNANLKNKTVNILPNIYNQCNPQKVLIENENIINEFIKQANDIVVKSNE